MERRDFGTWQELSGAILAGRTERRVTRKHLADRAGIPVALLGHLERGGRTDDRAGLVRILEELGIDARTVPIPDEHQAGERARQWQRTKRAQELDPPSGQYLRPRPESSEGAKVVVALDLDGVLNRLPSLSGPPRSGRQPVVGPTGERLRVDVSKSVARALDKQIRRPGVSLAWLTSWGRAVDHLLGEVLGGRYLTNGYVLAERLSFRYVAASWKLDALTSHLLEVGCPAYCWADDDAVDLANLDPEFQLGVIAGGPRLLISPIGSIGLTLDDVDQIESFIDEHATK